MGRIDISVISYQEGEVWIAQGLEWDITAQAPSLPEVRERFHEKLAREVAISLDLDKAPLSNIEPAPEVKYFGRCSAKLRLSLRLRQLLLP